MVAVALSAGSMARIRFGVSSLWEVVTSIRVLHRPDLHTVHAPWIAMVRPALVAARLVDDEASLLWSLIRAEPAYLPDFLTPIPAGLVGDLDADLAALRATLAETVRDQLDLGGLTDSGPLRALTRDPAGGLRRLSDQISDYWRIALSKDWPRIRALLDAEVSTRAYALARDGADGLLRDLHPSVTWTDGTLSIAKTHCDAADIAACAGLVLVPSVFVWPSALTVPDPEWPQLAYPARGVATLWEPAAAAPEPLVGILGRTRARLLIEMWTPTSTTELARRVGITPGGASQHLSALRAAGLVRTRREGRAVMSVRTEVAEALLRAAS